MSLNAQLQTIMSCYMTKYRRTQATIHNLGDGLQIRTTTPIQSTIWGRNKFKFGYETVWLQIKQPNKEPVVIARLSETKHLPHAFSDLAIKEYQELINKHLDTLSELAT